ncbi:tRNA lysidine(34) synthetase TilS [Haloimpatiens sp. FM7330]|uniref:tRNA lysidine(34) synthetase TilS n=1 Tax=Haloimpatiens sp. FM7330 TaxID=3298610 RepID=UPI0036265F05
MLDKVLETIKVNNMFAKGDKVIVAVSGGPDSMCLLHMLYNIKNQLDISIVVAHLNHCLRGKDADEDEKCVEKFCEKVGVKFFSKRVDVNKLANDKNISCELAGREARYQFFHEVKDKTKAQKIAVAHNANDKAETVIMRIIRGTGLDGLSGIKPIRDNVIVRPIINLTRQEIEEYCKQNNIDTRIDKTNLENIYSRNKIRLELIPYIEKNFNKDIINTINRFSEIVSKDNEYLEKLANDKYEMYCNFKNGKIIINKQIFYEDEAILTRVVRICLLKIKGNLYNLEKKHIYDILKIQKHSTGKKINLPGNLIVTNNYGDIYIYNKQDMNFDSNEQVRINLNSKQYINNLSININTCIEENNINIKYESNEYIKYFDFEKIQGDILLRFRRKGDRFTPLGMKGSKKLKDLFMDLKIPKDERDRIPLICFGNNIGWVVGYRISEKYKIDRNTRKILKIHIEKGENINAKYQ